MRALGPGPVWIAACLALCACNKTTLRSGLSELEANQIIVALDSAAISASKTAQAGSRDHYDVEVASSTAASALAVLEAQRLPKRTAPGFDDLYEDNGLWATPAEERARWTAATAGELARSLERLQGVLDARVHLALPDHESALDAPIAEPKAAVIIRHLRAAPAPDEGAVRALVAGAVEGLSPERVTVVQVPASQPAPSARSLAQVGPFAVARDSAAALRAVLGLALVIDLGLAIALVLVVRRARARAAS